MKAGLLFLLLTDLTLSDDSVNTSRNTKLIVSQIYEKFHHRYKLEFYASNENDTLLAVLKCSGFLSDFECNICLNQRFEYDNLNGEYMYIKTSKYHCMDS